LTQVVVVLSLDRLQMARQVRGDDGRQGRHAVLVALPAADDELAAAEVHILYAKLRALEQAQARAVEEQRHEPGWAFHEADNRADLLAAEHPGKARGPLGAHHVVEPGQALADLAIEEQQRAQRLVLRRRGDVPLHRERAQELRHLRRAQDGRG
jgi:hypothetical protein